MVWGSQWDACMKWFLSQGGDKATYVTNSTGKGNYETTYNIPTGSNDNYSVNNIYDMAGNVEEWTIEAYDAVNRVKRRRLFCQFGFLRSSFFQGKGRSGWHCPHLFFSLHFGNVTLDVDL